MSTTTQKPAATAKSSVGTRRGQRGPLPTRARVRSQLLIGLLLVVGCALVGALLFINAGDRVAVLAVRDKVAPGQRIERSDLVSKEVAGLDDAIPVADVSKVVGKTASVGLVAGQVLSPSLISSKAIPGEGEALAGLALTRAQLPSAGLEPGDTVRILAVASAEEGGGETRQPVVLSQSAQVYAISNVTEGDAAKAVTVVVPNADADRVQTFAAAGRVAIVKTAGGAS